MYGESTKFISSLNVRRFIRSAFQYHAYIFFFCKKRRVQTTHKVCNRSVSVNKWSREGSIFLEISFADVNFRIDLNLSCQISLPKDLLNSGPLPEYGASQNFLNIVAVIENRTKENNR